MRQGAARESARTSGMLYETPACATQALIRTGELDKYKGIWEPCAGRGAIIRELAPRWYVHAGDLCRYEGADVRIVSGADFLLEKRPWSLIDAIVTNPPFSLADEFIRHGLSLGLPVIVLLRLMALEGAKRSDIVDKHLRRVWAGVERLPMMHREGWEGNRLGNSGAPFGWFVFEPEPRGDDPIELRRMSWRV